MINGGWRMLECKNISILKIIGIYLVSFVIVIPLMLGLEAILKKDLRELMHITIVVLFYAWAIGHIFSKVDLSTDQIGRIINFRGLKRNILFVLKIAILIVILSISNTLIIISIVQRKLPTVLVDILNNADNNEQMKLAYLIIRYALITPFVAPVSEEIIFRFGVFNKLKIKHNKGVSILLTSIFFMALHQSYKMLDAFIFSVLMCIIYERSQNLLLPIAIHIINNLIPSIIIIYEFFNKSQQVVDIAELNQLQVIFEKYWWMLMVLSVTILVTLTISIRRKFRNRNFVCKES